MLKLLVLVFAGQLLMFSFCETMSVYKRGQKLCGRQLTEALSLICEGYYFDPYEPVPNTKREYITPHVATNFYPFWFPGLPLQRMSKFGHHQMLPATRQGRGVVDECCERSCSFDHLTSYCRPRK